MLILRDDRVLETFDSPQAPPSWIEAVDVENGEYEFCSDLGQRYIGTIHRAKGMFDHDTFELIPDGVASEENLEKILNQAVSIEDATFKCLEDLKAHLTNQRRPIKNPRAAF